VRTPGARGGSKGNRSYRRRRDAVEIGAVSSHPSARRSHQGRGRLGEDCVGSPPAQAFVRRRTVAAKLSLGRRVHKRRVVSVFVTAAVTLGSVEAAAPFSEEPSVITSIRPGFTCGAQPALQPKKPVTFARIMSSSRCEEGEVMKFSTGCFRGRLKSYTG